MKKIIQLCLVISILCLGSVFGRAEEAGPVKVVVGKIHQDLKQYKKILYEPIVDQRSLNDQPAVQARLLKLLNNLEANGTEDINKCFIPRHAALVYQGDQLKYKALICFECDGVRFYQHSQTESDMPTNVKSAKVRVKLMKELEKVFSQMIP